MHLFLRLRLRLRLRNSTVMFNVMKLQSLSVNVCCSLIADIGLRVCPLCAKSGHQYVSSLLTEKLLAWTYRWVVTGIRDFFAHRNKADIS